MTAMLWDDLEPRKKPTHEIGADLSAASIEELEDHLRLLDDERRRVEALIAKKKASQSSADAVFKK